MSERDMNVYMPKKQDMVEFEEHMEALVRKVVSENQSTAKPKWWHFNGPQLVTMLIVLIGYGVTIGKTDARIASTEIGLERMVITATATAVKVEANTRSVDLDHAVVLSHETRLARLEDVNEKLAVIQTKVEQSQHDMVEMKNQVSNLSTAFTGFQIELSKYPRK